MDEKNLENLEIVNQLVLENKNLIEILKNYFENRTSLSNETILPSIEAIYKKQEKTLSYLKTFSLELYKQLLMK